MLTQQEIDRIIQEEGELAAADKCAIELVDALLTTVNAHTQESMAFGHPLVVLPVASEFALVVITQSLPREQWKDGIKAITEQLEFGVQQQLETPPENAEEPTHGEG